MSIATTKNQKGLWLFVAPVSGLELSDAIGNEITIHKVTFVSKEKLPRIRKRLGFPMTIADLRKGGKQVFESLFNDTKTFAICQLGGVGAEKEREFVRIVRDEINILSLSQLGYGRRRSNASISLAHSKQSGSLMYFMIHSTNKTGVLAHKVSGKFMRLLLDENWKQHQKFSYFYELLKLIKGEFSVSDGWRRDIFNAALLAGQSQSSIDLPQAFLWNMIAIETLLTHQGDSYSSALPKRVEAFIGWSTDWSILNYQQKIAEVYKKRCQFVHAGQTDRLTMEDLLFTDVLLVNIFYNILKHLDLFSCKEALIKFSEKVEAEHVLGVKPKVRPKSMCFLNMNYSDQDYVEI